MLMHRSGDQRHSVFAARVMLIRIFLLMNHILIWLLPLRFVSPRTFSSALMDDLARRTAMNNSCDCSLDKNLIT